MSALKIVTHPCGPARIILYNRLMRETKYKVARSVSTVNTKEIEHYARLKDIWWTEKMEGLRRFNPLRVQFVRDGLANTGFKEQTPSLPLQGVKIADVGCGGGFLTEALARVGAQVTGIDISEELITVAKEHAELDPDVSKRVNYVCTNIETFAAENEKLYDAIISSEVIEHVYNQEFFLKESVKLVKPGGSIFLTTPNKTLTCWFFGIIVAEYIIKAIPRGTHDWKNFVTPPQLQRMLEKNGCQTKLIHGIMYNPATKHWFWSSSTALCYGLHAVKQKEVDA